MRWIKKKNYTFGFNLSFGFFPQCSLHIHASYSISQKLNVPMAPLSEPNAVGIVIAHGKRPSLTSVGRISWEHWSSVIALNPVRKPPSVAFTTLCRISCKITILWEKKKWYCGFFMDSYQRAATWPLPLPNCRGLFFYFPRGVMGNNQNKLIQNSPRDSESSLFHCWCVLMRWWAVL